MTLSAWFTVALAIPVLLLGEFLVRKFKFLGRFNIPAPVVGGLLIFLAISTVLAVAQNLVGVPLAMMMGQSPLLGLVCGSLTLAGGMGTAIGFAPELEKAGLQGAAVVSVAAATFGLVAGGLLGGPLGGWLIQRHRLQSEAGTEIHLEAGQTGESGILPDLCALLGFGKKFWGHLLLLLFCIKAGVWVSFFIRKTGIIFPVYMGAMILGLVL